MPKENYSPNSSASKDLQPLEAGQYPGCVLEKIYAFRQKQKDEETGNEFTRVKLSLYWNSGYTMPDSDDPFYITDGFVTLSFHERANLTKMLDALGVMKAGENVELEYELGGEFEGRTLNELPIYDGGPKKDIEVPVNTLQVNGQELIGITATLIISVKQSGWNKIELVLPDAPKTTARPGPRRAEPGKAEAPVSSTAPKAAQGDSEPLWLTWRSKTAAIKWAATLRNSDGSPAYPTKHDAESVWLALRLTYEGEVFEPNDLEFMWHWHRWHVIGMHGGEFSFQDFPDETEFKYFASQGSSNA